MHRSLILFALGLVALAQAAPVSEESTWAWEQFKSIHGKTYEDEQEEASRRFIFEQTLADVKEHNELFLAGLVSYSKEVNKFADMHLSEVVGTGLMVPNITREEVYVSGADLNAVSKDWRQQEGVVTPVKNQGQCGSCWAFSTTGALEGQWKLKKGVSVSLSEQQLVDCATRFGTFGCRGGWMEFAYNYIKWNQGIESERDYPYRGYDDTCHADRTRVTSTVSGYHMIAAGDERELTQAVQTVGPVAVAVSVTRNFQYYRGGVFSDPQCAVTAMNHAILAVGLGTDPTYGDYYIVKNSWSTAWGESGYIRMARNRNNMCKIASHALYPLV